MDKPLSNQTPIQVALIGLGQKGKLLFNAIIESSEFELTHILVNMPEELSPNDLAFASQCEEALIHPVSHIEELLKNHDVDAVFLASQANIHLEIMKLCAKYQVPILCDKYIGSHLGQLKSLSQELKNRQAKASVLLPYRFDPALLALKEKLHNGDIGKPHVIKITNRLPSQSGVEENQQLSRLKHISRHDIDIIGYLSHAKIHKLSLTGQQSLNQDIKTQYAIHCPLLSLQLEDGLTAIIDYTTEPQSDFDQRIEVFGDDGMLRMDNLSEAKLQIISGKPQVHALPYWQFVERYRQAYRNAIKAFADFIHDDTAAPVSIEELLHSIEVQQLIEKAHREKSLAKSEANS